MYEDEEGEDAPRSSFVTYLAEGDKLYNAGDYQKALESYRTVRNKCGNAVGYLLFLFNLKVIGLSGALIVCNYMFLIL